MSVIKVLNKSVKAKKKERQEPSCCCHDNEAGYLDRDFWKSLKRIPRDVSVCLGRDKVFLYPPLKAHMHLFAEYVPINTGRDLRGARTSQAGRWRNGKGVGRGLQGRGHIRGKCKIKLPGSPLFHLKCPKSIH